MYRVRSKKVVKKKSLLAFTYSSIFRVPQQSHRRHFFKRKKSHSSSPAPLLFPHCCDAANGGRGERSVARGYITRTARLAFSGAASTCTVFSQHRCRCIQSTPSYRLINTRSPDQSHENEVLTVTWVDGWENQVVGVARVEEGGLACRVGTGNGWWFCRGACLPPSVCSPSRPALACVCALCAARSSSSSSSSWLRVCYTSLL